MKNLFSRLNYFEPARLRAIWAALISLSAALGLTIPAGVNSRVVAGIGALSVVIPVVQGELTRLKVTSPATADRISVNVPDAAAVQVGSGDVSAA